MSDALDNWGRDKPVRRRIIWSLPPRQTLQVAAITAAALGLYFFMRWLPTGTNLNHMDFLVTDKNALEFCDPANPQFIPVLTAKSPVTMTIVSEEAPAMRKEAHCTLMLRTVGGKSIGPADLLVAHTEKLHLLIVDATLSDYQHVHPVPGQRAGEWKFAFKPSRAGVYRVFADFTPAATQRGLYAAADFSVPGEVANVMQTPNTTAQVGFYRFELGLPRRFRAGKQAELTLRLQRTGAEKKPVPLEPVMGAFAHVVAFDDQRSGFAHLHPQQTDLTKPPDQFQPELSFKVLIPVPGRFVIWAQVKLAGDEMFIPFWVDVLPGGRDEVPELPQDRQEGEPDDEEDEDGDINVS